MQSSEGPSPPRHPHNRARFVPPGEFDAWREVAFGMGFAQVASGPLVRSSYHAKEFCGRG